MLNMIVLLVSNICSYCLNIVNNICFSMMVTKYSPIGSVEVTCPSMIIFLIKSNDNAMMSAWAMFGYLDSGPVNFIMSFMNLNLLGLN